MRFIKKEFMESRGGINLAPMVDFLFLVVAIFAVIAVTRTSIFDSQIHLAEINDTSEYHPLDTNREMYTVNISLSKEGKLKWLTESEDLAFGSPAEVSFQLDKMVDEGSLPEKREETRVLLHIDKEAQWDPIVNLVQTLNQAGYSPHPVYQ